MVDDIVEELGHLALGTRLKRLGERLQAETTRFIETSGLPVPNVEGRPAAADGDPTGTPMVSIARSARMLDRRRAEKMHRFHMPEA